MIWYLVTFAMESGVLESIAKLEVCNIYFIL